MTFKEWYEFNKDIFITPVEKFTIHVKDKDSGNIIFDGLRLINGTELLFELFGKYKMLKCEIDYFNYDSLIITLSNKVKD